uniref:Uncharacterized protein n=1 Tax=Schistocephalus solidus TaxID=70667 RepID=A0A0X3NPR4_SCHSO
MSEKFYRPAKGTADQPTKLPTEYRRKNATIENEWHQMISTDVALAQFYGLTKIHKANVPLQPIVASKLKKLQGNLTVSVRSAAKFLVEHQGRTIQSDKFMVSFGVTSLSTSIPPNSAHEVLCKRLE